MMNWHGIQVRKDFCLWKRGISRRFWGGLALFLAIEAVCGQARSEVFFEGAIGEAVPKPARYCASELQQYLNEVGKATQALKRYRDIKIILDKAKYKAKNNPFSKYVPRECLSGQQYVIALRIYKRMIKKLDFDQGILTMLDSKHGFKIGPFHFQELISHHYSVHFEYDIVKTPLAHLVFDVWRK